MELHTLGVDAGYTQQDVQQLARVLTGVGINAGRPPQLQARVAQLLRARRRVRVQSGAPRLRPKVLLGQTIEGSGFAEVDAGGRR